MTVYSLVLIVAIYIVAFVVTAVIGNKIVEYLKRKNKCL
jgi:hypothetical protein